MSTASADVVRGVFDAAARGDKEAMFGLLRPGVEWQLIGLHHKGDAKMAMLNGKPGTYEANEGIWIRAIIAALAKQLAENQTQ